LPHRRNTSKSHAETVTVATAAKDGVDHSTSTATVAVHGNDSRQQQNSLPSKSKGIKSDFGVSMTCARQPLRSRQVVDTPRKAQLRKKIKQLQSRRRKVGKRLQLLKNAKVTAKQPNALSVAHVVSASESYLSPLQFAIFCSQLTAHQKRKQGYRWPVKEKLFCLQLHYKSPAAYCFVSWHFTLPSLSTIIKFVSNAVG